ncbi:MAG: RNA polymerase sigma factor [Actinomycetota bacterium]
MFTKETYGRIVAAVRLVVRDGATAEDLTQEAFARLYLSWSKLWPEGNPAGWVYRVATNLAINWHRRAGRELRAIARLQRSTPMTTPAPEAYPELHAAVAALPRRQRAAVALHYVLGLTMDEAAKAMGCRPGTVKSLLFSARERLRKELGDE